MPTDHTPRKPLHHHQQQRQEHVNAITHHSQQQGEQDTSGVSADQASQKQRPLFRYAKRFALLTLITAYLGKHASDEDGGSPATTTGLLYDYLLPGISSAGTQLSSWPLLSLVLFCLAVNKFLQTARYHMKQFQRTITNQAIQSVKSVNKIGRSTTSRMFLKSAARSNDKSKNNTPPSEQQRLVLSDSENFLDSSIMEQMTLADMAVLFQYAQQINDQGFDRNQFVQKVRKPAQDAMDALDRAIAASRGSKVQILLLPSSKKNCSSDTMDALAFCAVACIFAEWRNVRAVPPGCPGYAFGMNLARRDLIQNIRKMEQAVHQWLDFHQGGVLVTTTAAGNTNTTTTTVRSSPTVRQLLQHELEINLHPRLPRLVEQSAASGLLWIKRQLQYQSSAMENNAKVPLEFPTPKAAFNAAYESVYGKYHGFLVRTVFQNTFEAAPPAKDVLRHMNKPYDDDEQVVEKKEVEEDGEPRQGESLSSSSSSSLERAENSQDEDGDETWIQLPLDEWEGEWTSLDDVHPQSGSNGPSPTSTVASSVLNDEDLLNYRDYDDDFANSPHDLDLGGRIVQVLTSVFGHCVVCKDDERGRKSRNALSSFHASGTDKDLVEQLMKGGKCSSSYSSTAAERNDVPMYLSTLRLLEGGLEKLIQGLNMNDPSRV